MTPARFLERAGYVYSDRLAVVDGDQRLTFGEWRLRSRRFASALRRHGLGRGDRIAFLAFNSEELLLAHQAVPLAGGVLVAINFRLTAPEVARIVNHSAPTWIFYSRELADRLPPPSPGVSMIALGDAFEHLLLDGSEDAVDWWVDDENAPISINYTSGTTGQPKGAVYDHRGAFLNALAMVIENRLTLDSRMLWTLPMFHCNGWSHTWAVVAAGATSVCLPAVDPERIWLLLDEEVVTHFNAAPTVLTMLAMHPSAHRLRRRVRVCTGGAAPTPTLIADMQRLNVDLIHLYGLTETYGPVTINVGASVAKATDSMTRAHEQARQGVGHVIGTRVRVVDEHLRELPCDGHTVGEVVVAGNTVMKGYYRDQSATEDAFRGGWLHTGDLGVTHPDGRIEIRDRSKDIVITGGENVSSIEVEAVLAAHPAVMECAVVASPDDTWGEAVKAFVTVKPGRKVTEDALIKYCRTQLAHFKCPKMVEFGLLPKTSTGKIQKYLLREREQVRHSNGTSET